MFQDVPMATCKERNSFTLRQQPEFTPIVTWEDGKDSQPHSDLFCEDAYISSAISSLITDEILEDGDLEMPDSMKVKSIPPPTAKQIREADILPRNIQFLPGAWRAVHGDMYGDIFSEKWHKDSLFPKKKPTIAHVLAFFVSKLYDSHVANPSTKPKPGDGINEVSAILYYIHTFCAHSAVSHLKMAEFLFFEHYSAFGEIFKLYHPRFWEYLKTISEHDGGSTDLKRLGFNFTELKAHITHMQYFVLPRKSE